MTIQKSIGAIEQDITLRKKAIAKFHKPLKKCTLKVTVKRNLWRTQSAYVTSGVVSSDHGWHMEFENKTKDEWNNTF